MKSCGEKGSVTRQIVAGILSEGILCKSTGLIMRGAVPPVSLIVSPLVKIHKYEQVVR